MLKSYAKLNIFLKVTGKLGDYHLLESLFVYIDLFDQLEIAKSKQNSLQISGQYQDKLLGELSSSDEALWENSIFAKTYRIFQKEFAIADQFLIKLEKNIPIGAGLGGGSSNAACFLKYLLNFYNIDITQQEQYKLAAKIGADCAFFMQGNARLISGFGDQVGAKITIKPCSVSLLNFGISSYTKDVFKEYAKSNKGYSDQINLAYIASLENNTLTTEDLLSLSKTYGNDLESAFFSLNRSIQERLSNMPLKGLDYFVSGSGSIMFFYPDLKKYVTSKEGYVILREQFILNQVNC